jgi:ribulose-phosphate 3-epimerase
MWIFSKRAELKRFPVLKEILSDLDLVLVKTVNPRLGIQHFIQITLPKIQRVRQMTERRELNCEVQVDGGVDEQTGPLAAEGGADVLAAGSSTFGSKAGFASAMGQLFASTAHHPGVLQP